MFRREKAGAALLRARLPVVEPHLLLGVDEDELPGVQAPLQEVPERPVHIGRLGDDGYRVDIPQDEAVKPRHHVVRPLADGHEAPPAGEPRQRPVDAVVEGVEMIAGEEGGPVEAGQPLQAFDLVHPVAPAADPMVDNLPGDEAFKPLRRVVHALGEPEDVCLERRRVPLRVEGLRLVVEPALLRGLPDIFDGGFPPGRD